MSGEFEARRGDSARAAIELIEKAMEGVTPGPWQTVQTRTDIQRLTVAGPSEIVCGLDGICEPDRMNDRLFAEDAANMRYIAACNPLAMSAILAEARKAVEMEMDRKREAQLATDMASDCLDEQKRREAAEARVATLERVLEFVALWAWRADPPNANSKLTDDERLSVIKHHPTVKSFYETGARALLSKESADAQG